MPSINVRPESGLLYLDFRYRGVRCREQTALPDTPVNRKRVDSLLRQIEKAIAEGSFDYASFFPGSPRAAKFAAPGGGKSAAAVVQGPDALAPRPVTPLFSDFVETWFKENVPRWRFSYRDTVRCTIDRHLLPRFGATPVADITRPEILAFRAHLMIPAGEGSLEPAAGRHAHRAIGPVRINKVMNLLRMVLAEAADRFGFELTFRNIKTLKQQKKGIQPFTFDEVQQLIGAIREDYRDYLIVRFFTGLRTGEINGLKWKYVDFEKNQLLIRETYMRGRDEYTKNDGSQREVPMMPLVREAMERHKADAAAGVEYVFVTRNGRPIDTVNFTNRVWYPLLRHLGLDRRRPYQTRHTAATLMLASGEAPEWIAKILGHTTTEMLFRVYSRFVPNLTRNDGAAYAGLLARKMAPSTSTATREVPMPPPS